MGQYWVPVNIDKNEKLYSHHFGEGLKLGEWGMDACGMLTALQILLLDKSSVGFGGGDWHFEDAPQELVDEVVGRWAGDRIVVVGDYSESEEYAPLYDSADDSIGKRCIELMSYVAWLTEEADWGINPGTLVDVDHKWVGPEYHDDKTPRLVKRK